MIKRFDVEVETQLPDEASFDEFQMAFTLPLAPSTREAMQVLFPGRNRWASSVVRAS
jgi:phosphatidylserine decarboxylase